MVLGWATNRWVGNASDWEGPQLAADDFIRDMRRPLREHDRRMESPQRQPSHGLERSTGRIGVERLASKSFAPSRSMRLFHDRSVSC